MSSSSGRAVQFLLSTM